MMYLIKHKTFEGWFNFSEEEMENIKSWAVEKDGKVKVKNKTAWKEFFKDYWKRYGIYLSQSQEYYSNGYITFQQINKDNKIDGGQTKGSDNKKDRPHTGTDNKDEQHGLL